MKVSRRSWHYRLYRYLKSIGKGPRYLVPWGVSRADVEIPTNLCPYFWSLVSGVIGTAFLLALSAVFVIPYVVAAYAVAGGRSLDRKLKSRRARSKEKPEAEAKPERPKEPSLVKTFVRAHKDQVCPTIKLVD